MELQNNNYEQFLEAQYEHFAEMYQSRYALASQCSCGKCITWRKISYWRNQMNFYGGKLIERNLLPIREHLKNKYTVITELQDGFKVDVEKVREEISLT